MENINYSRALLKAKCTSCNYDGYDLDFEEHRSIKVEVNTYVMDIVHKCPKCYKYNTMFLLEEPFPEPTIQFLDEELDDIVDSDEYWEQIKKWKDIDNE